MWFVGLRKKTKIADLVPGKVSLIKGTIQSTTRELTLPPSGTNCVYYSMMQEKYGKGARGSGRALWFPEKMERKCVQFSVSDDSGEVVIQATGEQLDVSGGHQEAGAVKGKGKRRYFASFMIVGDHVVIRGLVESVKGDNGVVLTATEKKNLNVAVVRRAPLKK